jgi:hypothetical protein
VESDAVGAVDSTTIALTANDLALHYQGQMFQLNHLKTIEQIEEALGVAR